MLQQTQVATVVPYYGRFLERFPDVASLAAATEEQVLACWTGLGYYRRASGLRAAAVALVERHGGRLPADPAALRALPGVGRYTAGAIASIAFDLPEPVLDGNVRRVLARLLALDGARVGRAREERALWAAATALVRGARPGDLNQALMELGALVCTPGTPDCPRCPLHDPCRARRTHRTASLPAARLRPRARRVAVAVAWIVRAGRLLLERPGDGSPLRGRFDLPAVEVEPAGDAGAALREKLRRDGLDVAVGEPLARLSHAILDRRLALEVRACRLVRGRAADPARRRWVPLAELSATPHSSATRKAALAVAERDLARSGARPRRRPGPAAHP
jgi:A/G-specific adenine glycosylase